MENTQTKTALEWFQELPEDVREKAIANTKKWRLSEKYESLKDALFHSFVWIDSPEKDKFWCDIHINL